MKKEYIHFAVTYSAVQTDNCQGGNGRIFHGTIFFKCDLKKSQLIFKDDFQNKVKEKIKQTEQTDYPIENILIKSVNHFKIYDYEEMTK